MKKKILIVEDSATSRRFLSSALSGDYEIKEAVTAEDVYDILPEFIPDLILLDIVLPGISGIELCSSLVKDKRYADIPVIMLTTRTDDTDVKTGLEAGALDYIRKPCTEIELKARIKNAIHLYDNLLLLKKANTEKEELIKHLEDALKEVKRLSGLLPICASCKKIRDDSGYWKQVEEYISIHSDATFTHGICPECVSSLYPDLDIDDTEK